MEPEKPSKISSQSPEAQDGWSFVEYDSDGNFLPCEVISTLALTDDWIFSNTEPFQVKPKHGKKTDDKWLVGRKGKPIIQVSLKDLNGGLGRPYYVDRIPWRLISIKIGRWVDEEEKQARRTESFNRMEKEWQQRLTELKTINPQEPQTAKFLPVTWFSRFLNFLKSLTQS